MDVQTRRDVSKTVEDKSKLLLRANRKSYMPSRLAQQRMTFSDLKWPFHGSSVPSVWQGLQCHLTVHFSPDLTYG